ncbi:LCP family protein [Sinomonas sp. P10A9]|uniref:LCP family protein n=1 Tax=Sinomonas puerhi TaxID=3238584 RepID=A0AB39LAV8_9MICC
MAGPAGDGGARRRRVRSRVLLAAVVLVVVVGAVVATFLLMSPRATPPAGSPSPTPTASASETVSSSPSATLPPLASGAMNILVLGSDIRGNARDAVARQEAGGGVVDQRSDMIMLIHVPADRSRVFGISIMRDTWVTIAGHGQAKVNAALALGGPRLAADTVAAMLSTRIDHYAMLDFDGFKAITDALGGVDVNVPLAFTATFDTHHAFAQGLNHLDGQAALEFVRERYAFADGDYQRVRDQQAFVRSLVAQLLTTGRVRGPAEAMGAVALASPYVITDPGLDATGIAALGYGLRGIDPAADVFFTLPTAGTGTSADGQSIVVPDDAGIAEVAAALARDDLGGYAAAHGLG